MENNNNSEKSSVIGDNNHDKKIMKSSSSSTTEENHDFTVINKGEHQRHNYMKQQDQDDNSKPWFNKLDISSSTTINELQLKDHDEIESAKAKMGEVKEENERLKLLLFQIVKDDQSLQTRFNDALQKDQEAINNKTASSHEENCDQEEPDDHHDDLIALSLGGRCSRSDPSTKDNYIDKKNNNMIMISNGKGLDDGKSNTSGNNDEGLELGLECKFEPDGSAEPEKNNYNNDPSSDQSSLGKHDQELEEAAAEVWPPSKILKTKRSEDEEDASEPMQLKKTRVSVRTRCDTPTMNDGCQWRKYGQKIAKGNPCPRAYYRCTLSPNCPVRKQVQRCSDDRSILITTYEGNHNHPLPLNATAMASTTSAAASMLQSQSSTSQPGPGTSLSAPSSTTASSSAANHILHASNFNFAQKYNFPNSSISTSNSHPTVTLDLTTPPYNNTTSSSYFTRFSNVIPRYSSACLNFSSSPSSSSSSLELLSNPQASWKNTSHLNFGAAFPNPINSTFNYPGRQQSPYMQMTNLQSSLSSDTIAVATKAITANPSFCSALAAALTSFVGNRNNNISGTEGSLSLPLKRAHHDVDNAVGFASSYSGKSSSMNNNQHHHPQQQQQQKQGGLLLFPTTSKTTSDPPPPAADNSNHIK